MAEQKLDVKVTESGTSVVTSQLDKLTAQLTGIEKAQEKETAATEKAAAATEKNTAALEGWLKTQEGKFAVVDRIAGLMGKVNQTLELLNKAYEFGKMVVEDYILKMKSLEPALDGVNKKLQTQAEMIKRIREAPGAAAAAAGASLAGVTPEQADRLRGLKAEEELATAQVEELQARAEAQRNFIRAQVESPLENERKTDEARRWLAETTAQLEKLDGVLTANAETRKRIEADIRTRGEGFDTFGPEWEEPKKKPVAPVEEGGVEAAMDANAAEAAKKLADLYGSGGSGDSGQGGAAIKTTTALAEQVDTLAAAYANAATMAGDFAEATGKAALASAVAAAFAGKSVLAAVSDTLKARAQEATVEALWALGKGLFYSVTDPALAGPYFAAAGYFGATAAAAGVGAAVLGGGGGGGGGSSAGASAPSSADFGPRRERDTGGGQTIVNVYNDGLTLSTENDIGRAVAGSLRAVARSPGSQSGAIQINTGGSRRR